MLCCPKCKSDKNKVIDSRKKDDFEGIYRQRECLSCGARYPTQEVIIKPKRKPKAAVPVLKRKPKKKRRLTPRPKIAALDYSDLTDEQLEELIGSDDFNLDEL